MQTDNTKKQEILELIKNLDDVKLQEILTFSKEIAKAEPIIIRAKEIPDENLPE